jgi:hypothetical protein
MSLRSVMNPSCLDMDTSRICRSLGWALPRPPTTCTRIGPQLSLRVWEPDVAILRLKERAGEFRGVDLRLMARRGSNRAGSTRWSLFIALLLVATACARANAPAASPSPDRSPLAPPGLKLAVLDAVGGHLTYCDPDLYPVARGAPLERARARFPTIRADRLVFDAILQHEHLSADQKFTPEELISISDDYKQMQAIDLKPAGDAYAFDLQVPQRDSDVGVSRVTGTVNSAGAVAILHREVGQRPKCPICLVAGVLIATPRGNVPVQDVRVGMPVWTTDGRGERIAAVVLESGHMEAPVGHEVVRLTLADGRVVIASPGHPTADGRTVGALRPGDRYDGTVVARVMLIPYGGVTWDLLPSGPSGTYFANGVLLGSTLHRGS